MQRQLLVKCLSDKVESKKYQYLNSDIFKDEYYSDRTINEWIVLILSTAVLNEYRTRFDYTDPEMFKDISSESEKLGRNYCRYGFDAEKTQKALMEMIANPPLKDIEELKKLLDLVSINENVLFNISGNNSSKNIEKVKTKIENLLYNFEIRDAREMYELAEHNVYMVKPIPRKSSRNFSVVMSALAEDLSFGESYYMIAYLLQMMDGGFINAAANDKRCLFGYDYSTQIAKVAEQSSIIFPFRLHKYIPMLSDAWWYCRLHRFNRSYRQHEEPVAIR